MNKIEKKELLRLPAFQLNMSSLYEQPLTADQFAKLVLISEFVYTSQNYINYFDCFKVLTHLGLTDCEFSLQSDLISINDLSENSKENLKYITFSGEPVITSAQGVILRQLVKGFKTYHISIWENLFNNVLTEFPDLIFNLKMKLSEQNSLAIPYLYKDRLEDLDVIRSSKSFLTMSHAFDLEKESLDNKRSA